MFWEAMEQLSDEERSFVLKFATGRIRLCVTHPLRAPFVCAESPSVADRPVNLKVEFESSDSDMLPTSATCYQSIYMPKYSDAEKMLTKLRIAFEAVAVAPLPVAWGWGCFLTTNFG